MSYMRFCVMDVGQGSANYIELRENDDSLTAAGIVDIGSEQWKTAAGKPSAEWIADQLIDMTAGAVLDVIILSHSDSDHVNLIPSLIQYFDTPDDPDPTLPVLAIEEIIYGGDYAKYKKGQSRNFLDQLRDYHPESYNDTLTKLIDDFSSFDADKKNWKPLARIGGKIELWALSANTTAEKIPVAARGKRKRLELPDGGFATNTRSIVIAAIFGGKTIIATGDGTGLTLAHCNDSLIKPAVRDKLGNAYMVTLPHHGSDTTTYDLTGSAPDSDAAMEVVKKFVDWTKANTISGSAGERKTFRHPSARVIVDFGAHMLPAPQFIDPALTKTKQHFYTSYFYNRTLTVKPVGKKKPDYPKWPLFDWWYTARSGKNLFTTDYDSEPGYEIPTAYPWESDDDGLYTFTPAPPRAISWGFRVNQDGATSIQVVRNRTGAHAQYWAAAEAVHGPLPPRGFVVVDSAPLPGDDEPPPEPLAAQEPPRPGPPPPSPPPTPSRPSRLRQLP